MPRTHTRLVSVNLTPAQLATLKELAGKVGQSAYIRRLIAEDASKRGLDWPPHYGRGKHPRRPQGQGETQK